MRSSRLATALLATCALLTGLIAPSPMHGCAGRGAAGSPAETETELQLASGFEPPVQPRTEPRLSAPHADWFAGGAVAADHPDASLAGARALAIGGNAVDAAVAASFAISVTRPMSAGIGGGGFIVISLPHAAMKHAQGREARAVRTAINFRETAPASAHPAMYEASDPADARFGGRAVAIPGTVHGLLLAHERYGRLSRAEVLAPAIELARDGFASDEFHERAGRSTIERIESLPEGRTRFAPLLRALEAERRTPGARRTNPGHARALELVARDGASAFERGPIADAIVAATRAAGGSLTHADLESYKPSELEPLAFAFDGRTFLTMPPPSSGGVAMAQTLGIFAGLSPAARADLDDPRAAHALAESFKHAFADRARWLADPAFADVPTAWLLDPDRLAPFRAAVASGEPTRAPSLYGSPALDATARPIIDGGTSHVSATDRWGGAAACTTTINLIYGSLVLVEPFGFVLNDEMDDFQTRRGASNAFGLVQADANLPEPGKRPLSSMSPTIVLDEHGGVAAVAGGAGGPRIITATTQALLRTLSGENAGDAVAAPRMHNQWLPDEVSLEPGFGGGAAAEWLRAMGHAVRDDRELANVQLIVRDRGGWAAASDPRKGGRPAGTERREHAP